MKLSFRILSLVMFLSIVFTPFVPAFASSYTVFPVIFGSTLCQIASHYNTAIQAVTAANNLSSSVPSRAKVVSRSSDVKKRIPYTKEDVDLLARLIAAESRNQPNTAKVGVGAVVVNRVLSPKFPNTIKAVIYQPRQFGPARTGRINNPAPADCIIAAEESLRGVDPTNGALFFFDNKTKSRYLRSLPVSVTYGDLIFAYPK